MEAALCPGASIIGQHKIDTDKAFGHYAAPSHVSADLIPANTGFIQGVGCF
ncbi:MAG: hypothetical protein JWP80_2736 [Pseudomonas sp.]|nr:hypothetical protein [Pseudomonas sp.]